MLKFRNNAVTLLDGDVVIGAETFDVISSASFPTLSAGDWTYVSIDSEVVKVTAISGNTFTCDPLTADHISGVSVELRMTAEILEDLSIADDF